MLEWLDEFLDDVRDDYCNTPGVAAHAFVAWLLRVTRPRTPVYTPLHPMTQEEQERVKRRID
jgi:hypothetical protein